LELIREEGEEYYLLAMAVEVVMEAKDRMMEEVVMEAKDQMMEEVVIIEL